MSLARIDPVVIRIDDLRHQFDRIFEARPDYRGMRHELETIRQESTFGPAHAAMSLDVIADSLSKVVAFRARVTSFAVTMVNYATLWNQLEDSIEFEMKSIRRAIGSRSEIRGLTEKRQALAIDAETPHALHELASKTRIQRRFAESMKEAVDLELAQVDRTYEMVSRIETLILDERRVTMGPRGGT